MPANSSPTISREWNTVRDALEAAQQQGAQLPPAIEAHVRVAFTTGLIAAVRDGKEVGSCLDLAIVQRDAERLVDMLTRPDRIGTFRLAYYRIVDREESDANLNFLDRADMLAYLDAYSMLNGIGARVGDNRTPCHCWGDLGKRAVIYAFDPIKDARFNPAALEDSAARLQHYTGFSGDTFERVVGAILNEPVPKPAV